MTTLTVTRDRLLSDLLVGDRITAIDGRDLPRPHEVANPRVRTGMPNQYVVGLVNPTGSDTDWCLYEDQVEREITVLRDVIEHAKAVERGDAPSGSAIIKITGPRSMSDPGIGGVYTAKDFTVGQAVVVNADQGLRHGQVTKVARTRVHVRHPRNQRGDMVERPYPMSSIIVGQRLRYDGWALIYADGHQYSAGRRQPEPGIRVVEADQ
jgi:hypothetical protein